MPAHLYLDNPELSHELLLSCSGGCCAPEPGRLEIGTFHACRRQSPPKPNNERTFVLKILKLIQSARTQQSNTIASSLLKRCVRLRPCTNPVAFFVAFDLRTQHVCSDHATPLEGVHLVFVVPRTHLAAEYCLIKRWTRCTPIEEVLDCFVPVHVCEGEGPGNRG